MVKKFDSEGAFACLQQAAVICLQRYQTLSPDITSSCTEYVAARGLRVAVISKNDGGSVFCDAFTKFTIASATIDAHRGVRVGEQTGFFHFRRASLFQYEGRTLQAAFQALSESRWLGLQGL